jgi:hypothetical protein
LTILKTEDYRDLFCAILDCPDDLPDKDFPCEQFGFPIGTVGNYCNGCYYESETSNYN